MLKFKEIELSDREIITEYTKDLGISYYSFTTLYIWRHRFRHAYAIIDGALCIKGEEPGVPPVCFFPLGTDDIASVLRRLCMENQTRCLMPLTADMVKKVEQAMPGRFDVHRLESYDDYIYDAADLVELKGKKYHAKRNHINKFMQTYDYKYIPMTADNAHRCIAVEREWLKTKEHDEMMIVERDAICELVENFDALGLRGAMIEIDGKIVAFSIGELLRDDMAHIIAEKADVSYDGIYALINRDFAKNAWEGVSLINREEDMGDEGLRKAKRSYYPSRANEIYMLTKKTEV